LKGIEAVISEGTIGPTYIRFSSRPAANTEPWGDSKLVLDYGAAGGVVGIELLSLGPDVVRTLVEVARLKELDLSALVAQNFAVPTLT
jgi:hypothetical protein